MNRAAWRLLWVLSFALLLPATLLTAPSVLVRRMADLGRRLARAWRYCDLKAKGWVKVGPLWRAPYADLPRISAGYKGRKGGRR